MAEKPAVKLTGEDGNAFAIIGRCSKALKRAGLPEQATEFCGKAMAADSYNKVIQLAMEYCDVE